MSITHVASNVGTPNTASSPNLTSTSVVTKPTGLTVGDVMVGFATGNLSGMSAPAGWTLITSQDASTGDLFRVSFWYKVATSGDVSASNFTFTNGDAASPFWAAISAYRGVSGTSPINVSGINVASTTNPQTGPNVTTTASCMVLHYRAVRKSSGSTTFSSAQTERFDSDNHSTVGYYAALYDNNAESATGVQSGLSVTASSSANQTDTISASIALATGVVAPVNAAAGSAAVTVAASGVTSATGIAVSAGIASVTASAKAPAVLSGKFGNAGLAAVTAAVPDVARRAAPATATATVSSNGMGVFTGTPDFRTKPILAESRTKLVERN